MQQDPDYIIYDEATRSELVVPIRVDNEIIGVINIEHPEASAFSQQDQDTLVSLAAQAAIAIRNAEAYREAKILQQLGLDLASTLDLDEILQSILDSAMSLTSTTSGSILFWDAEHQRYFPAYASAGARPEASALQHIGACRRRFFPLRYRAAQAIHYLRFFG